MSQDQPNHQVLPPTQCKQDLLALLGELSQMSDVLNLDLIARVQRLHQIIARSEVLVAEIIECPECHGSGQVPTGIGDMPCDHCGVRGIQVKEPAASQQHTR